jgi:hypothetical protein
MKQFLATLRSARNTTSHSKLSNTRRTMFHRHAHHHHTSCASYLLTISCGSWCHSPSKNGTFANKDLAEVLGVDTPLTSIYLGHLTRKLSKTGVDAANWYTKTQAANGTLLTVRKMY